MKGSVWRGLVFLCAACLPLMLCSAVDESELHDHSPLTPKAYPKALKHLSNTVHGTIISLTIVVIFSLGAILRKLLDRVVSPRSLFWIHVGCQITGLALLITGFGVGVWVAILHDEVYNDTDGHVIFGTIIIALFLLQPIIGIQHHRLYKANKANNILRGGHIWFGRILIVPAIVNGGLGLKIGNNTTGGEKVYETLAAVIGFVYLVLVVLWYLNRNGSSGKNDVGNACNTTGTEGEVEEQVVEMAMVDKLE